VRGWLCGRRSWRLAWALISMVCDARGMCADVDSARGNPVMLGELAGLYSVGVGRRSSHDARQAETVSNNVDGKDGLGLLLMELMEEHEVRGIPCMVVPGPGLCLAHML
jgi:hypothetical protein